MAKRRNPKGSQFARGFLLGMLYAQGKVLTTERIRRELRASRATAKRDMKVIASLVNVTPSKALTCQKQHFPRMAVGGRTTAGAAALAPAFAAAQGGDGE